MGKARTRSSKFVKSYNKKTRMKSNGNGIKSTKAKTEKVLRFGSKNQLSSPSPPFSKQRKRDNKRHRYVNDKNQEDESEFNDDDVESDLYSSSGRESDSDMESGSSEHKQKKSESIKQISIQRNDQMSEEEENDEFLLQND